MAARAGREPLVAAAVVVGSIAVLAVAVLTGSRPAAAALFALLALTAAIGYPVLRRWETLLAGVIVVIFFIPIKRYTLPSSLAFNLEPYRVVIALVAAGWLTSLLIDPRVRLRASGLEPPILLFVLAALGSVAINAAGIHAVGLTGPVVKSLTFFGTFIVLFYVVVSVVPTRTQLDGLIRVVVGSGGVVAAAALVESYAHYNVFNHLAELVPLLHFNDPSVTAGLNAADLARSGQLRAYASAAHPIELSATLMMLLPLALYLFKRSGNKRWVATACLLALGSLATLSRTGVVMLAVVGLVFLWLRPRQTRRMWPALLLALPVVYVALPHTLGSFYAMFFPKGGIYAQQNETVKGNHQVGDGRLADIGPALAEVSRHPILGEGFGSRVTDAKTTTQLRIPRARILDDQWLGSLLEVGVLGAGALLWLFTRSVRRLTRVARSDDGDDGWLAVALTSAIIAFAVGMLTFDALGFVQVTILLFLLLGFSSVLVNLRRPA